MRVRRLLLVLYAVLLVATGAAADEGTAPCVPRVAEKLGIRFVEVCSVDPAAAPFWISAAPMPCSAGEHETIACPSVTPLLVANAGTSPIALTPRRVAMVDAFSAHRLCALRFAGHVPSAAELERARAAVGLAAVVVSETSGAGEFRFDALPEWTEDGACDNPSMPGKDCHFARWRRAAARLAPLADVRACTASRTDDDDALGAAVAIGDACPAPDWTWPAAPDATAQTLPCRLRAADGRAAFALACHAPDATPPAAPPAGADVAGFHCVVPTWALATFESPPPK